MAHFAQINETGTVVNVIVISNDDAPGDFPDSELIGQAFISALGFDGTWLQTSYNNNFRGQYAGIGMKYNSETDRFEWVET